jgi:hypothetical protein
MQIDEPDSEGKQVYSIDATHRQAGPHVHTCNPGNLCQARATTRAWFFVSLVAIQSSGRLFSTLFHWSPSPLFLCQRPPRIQSFLIAIPSVRPTAPRNRQKSHPPAVIALMARWRDGEEERTAGAVRHKPFLVRSSLSSSSPLRCCCCCCCC